MWTTFWTDVRTLRWGGYAFNGDGSLFYPFVTIMIPVVMMAEWIGNRDNMIHSYLRAISPSIRESVRDRGMDVAIVAARIAAKTA